ncbi:MAG: winged helix-turn-helix domain-containing protein [Tatlockia sp.]
MLAHKKYLFVIDKAPWEEAIFTYFAKFNYEIIQYTALAHLANESIEPEALLIHSDFFKKDLFLLDSLYQRYPVPLLVINDQVDEDVAVRMLEAGADDFLIKPIHPRELHARICAISRRVPRANEKGKEVLLFSGWRLYPASRQIFSTTNQELLLSAGEYDLLCAFINQPQRVLGRDFLLQVTKNSDMTPFDRRIDVQISRLRQKIEFDAKNPVLIKTIRNGGYLFTARVLTIMEN